MLTLSSLGSTLTDALDDLIGAERMDPQLAMKVLMQFDRVITEALNEKVKARLTFKVNILLFWILHGHPRIPLSAPTVIPKDNFTCPDLMYTLDRNTEKIHHLSSVHACSSTPLLLCYQKVDG